MLDLPMGQATRRKRIWSYLRFQGKRRALSCELEAAAVAVSWSSSVDPTTVSMEVDSTV